MEWLTIAAVLGVAGLVVVGVCVVRVAFALRRLSRQVGEVRATLEPKRAEPAGELAKTGARGR